MGGIYVHIPYCKQACYYCDFHFSTNLASRAEMVGAITREASLQKDYLGEAVESVYFGGGTPSLLTESEFARLFDSIRTNYVLSSDPEITLEANPDDLSDATLQWLFTLGVNRLSIGIQSYDDKLLAFLNRIHDGAAGPAAVWRAKEAGFTNLNIDLIYAIPGFPHAAWEDTIRTTLDLLPQHISAYALTVEANTVFGRWEAMGRFHKVAEETEAQQWTTLHEMLSAEGFDHYEISNFARPGHIALHNTNYWRRKKYLGLGPGAHSFNGISRQSNVSNNYIYIRALKEDRVPFTTDVLTREDHVNDYLLTSLRTRWGCDFELIEREYGIDLFERNTNAIRRLLDGNYAQLDRRVLRLTPTGMLFADKISSDLFVLSNGDIETAS